MTEISMPRHGNKYSLRAALPADQAAYLERRARRERRSVSSVVRQAIDTEIERNPLPAEDTEKDKVPA